MRQSGTRRPITRAVPYILVLIVAIGSLLVTLLRLPRLRQSIAELETEISEVPTATIERFAELRLPPGATNLQSHLSGSSNLLLHLRFDIVPSQLPDFLAGSRFPAELSDREIPPLLKDPFERVWWKPLEAARFQAARASFRRVTGGRSYQALLVDMSDSERYIVYVAVYNT